MSNRSIYRVPAISASLATVGAEVMQYRLLLTLSALSALLIWFRNGFYLTICLITLFCLLRLTWRHGKPGIIPFAFMTQWAQVVAYVLWMNLMHVDINVLSKNGGLAVVLSCVGLILMAITCTYVIDKGKQYNIGFFRKSALKWDPKKILVLYFSSSILLSSIGFAVGNTSGFSQILTAISSLKWLFFMIYGYTSFSRNGNKFVFLLMIGFEFVSGLYSYFSNFKDPIFFTAITMLTLIRTVTLKQIFSAIVLVSAVLFIMLTWTILKSDYRKFLNQGTQQQRINVSKSDAFEYIGNKVDSLTPAHYEMAIGTFMYRAQYVLHLAKTMDRVPEYMPHENGDLWYNNLKFVFIPRLLDPNKPVFDASEKTNKYTGLKYRGASEGASFSLGYFADSYVDFGHYLMFLPLALIGFFVGLIYRSFMALERLNLLARLSFINVCLSSFTAFESDGIILVGRLYTGFVTLYIIARFIFPAIQRWAYK